jgi:5'-3' exonuclease
MQQINRIILIDFSVFQFRAIFACSKNITNAIPATYTAMSMILSNLKELKATKNDKIIIACDSSKGSWRKDIDSAYKEGRKAKREASGIDWDSAFKLFAGLKTNLKYNTPFLVLEGDKLEADDIISVCCRYFSPTQCIVVSTDSDYEQLTCFSNVKVFSPITKKFKIVNNPYKLLAKKIEKERTDNLMSPVLTEEDYNKRKMLVDLKSLPDDIEKKTKKVLTDALSCDIIDFNWDQLMFKSLRKRYLEIFNKPKSSVPELDFS